MRRRSASVVPGLVARGQFGAGVAPLRLLVQRGVRERDRSAVIARAVEADARGDTFAPGGSSMNGMNLSGKPGMVQPMQMPPTFGHPPIPAIQPRLGTLQFTTGPQQPELHDALRRAVLGRRSRPARSSRRGRSPRARSCRRATSGGPASSSGIIGASPATWYSRYSTVSMKLSGCTGHPGTFTIGTPALDFQLPAQVVGQAHAPGRVSLPSRGFRRTWRTCRSRPRPAPSAPGGRSTRWS